MKEFNCNVRVYYEDTDAGGLVYHCNYIKYMERARTDWLREYGYSQNNLKQDHKIIFVVANMNIYFQKPAKMDDLLTVNARINKFGGASLLFQQSITNETATPICEAEIHVACLDCETMKPKRLPQSVREVFFDGN